MNIIHKVIKYSLLFVVNHILVGTHCYKSKRVLLNTIKNVNVEKGVSIVGPIAFYGSISIGENTFIGRDLNVEGNGQTIIGKNCDIAPHVCIITGSHEIGNHNRRAGKGFSGTVKIGDGCWICANTCILPNVSVGDGTITAANSLINKDIIGDCIVAGVPAKIVKQLEK